MVLKRTTKSKSTNQGRPLESTLSESHDAEFFLAILDKPRSSYEEKGNSFGKGCLYLFCRAGIGKIGFAKKKLKGL